MHGDLAEIASLVAHEHGVEIVAVIPASDHSRRIVVPLKALTPPADAVVVTSLEKPSEVYAVVCRAIGVERVYAPALLRVPATDSRPQAREKHR